ncbi:hypothetical protein [Streptomyces sp. NRRL F-5126]|uniref:hypothetical protein n=1 Tax=Streptomyces sp. NRRL F-5126 TaxID=1463857 RepID=UPI0004CC5A04|nr:hypothetical protein [Streptomyces sp. NRRL F-5126]
MAHDGNGNGSTVRRAARGVADCYRGGPYRFTLVVSAGTAVLACAILAGGFAATWGDFEHVRQYADENIANEDSYAAYADGSWWPLVRVGFVVFALALVLALLTLTVLHTGYAVGSRGEPQTRRELWRRIRRRFPAALVVNALTGVVVGAVEVAAYAWWAFVESDEIPGIEPTPLHETATPQYALVGWVLPVVVWCLAPVLYFRLSAATAETVLERRSPFVALYRSWVLTRRARWRCFWQGLLVTGAAVLVFLAGRLAAAPVAHFAGLGMLWLSDGNVWITGVLVKVLPTVVAFLLLTPLVMPPACTVAVRLHGDLGAGEG